jgi:ElaB/YqjD/DUF883 family membrane-anchored ribosome-binding protein
MADDIRIVPEDRSRTPLPAGAAAETQFEDPDEARAEIASTRARMSETIDEIEDVLLRKKARIQDRFDVMARIRENPLPALGIGLGVGMVLGLLTGGGDDDDRPARQVGSDAADVLLRERADHRVRRLEQRLQRVMRVARDQQEEAERLRRRLARQERRDTHGIFSLENVPGVRRFQEAEPSMLDRVREGVAAVVERLTEEIERRR